MVKLGRDTGFTKWANKNWNFNSWGRSWNKFWGKNGNDDPEPQPNMSKPYTAKTSEGQYYGGDGSGSFMDYFNRFLFETEQINPFTLAWDGVMGNIVGTDRYGNDLSGFDANMKIASAIPISKAAGVNTNIGERAIFSEAKAAIKSSLSGGKTFAQYSKAYWLGKSKPILDPIQNEATGQIWNQYMELQHRFTPQRWKWALNWLKNNRFNLQELNSLEHAMTDPYRARFALKWVKKLYNLTWK